MRKRLTVWAVEIDAISIYHRRRRRGMDSLVYPVSQVDFVLQQIRLRHRQRHNGCLRIGVLDHE